MGGFFKKNDQANSPQTTAATNRKLAPTSALFSVLLHVLRGVDDVEKVLTFSAFI
jgi:hypothetical protein